MTGGLSVFRMSGSYSGDDPYDPAAGGLESADLLTQDTAVEFVFGLLHGF